MANIITFKNIKQSTLILIPTKEKESRYIGPRYKIMVYGKHKGDARRRGKIWELYLFGIGWKFATELNEVKTTLQQIYIK